MPEVLLTGFAGQQKIKQVAKLYEGIVVFLMGTVIYQQVGIGRKTVNDTAYQLRIMGKHLSKFFLSELPGLDMG